MAVKKKRPKTGNGQHRKGQAVSVYLWPEAVQQLHELADALHMTRSAAVSLALGRLYKQEKLDAKARSA